MQSNINDDIQIVRHTMTYQMHMSFIVERYEMTNTYGKLEKKSYWNILQYCPGNDFKGVEKTRATSVRVISIHEENHVNEENHKNCL